MIIGNVSAHIGNGGISAPYSRYSKITSSSPLTDNQWNHIFVGQYKTTLPNEQAISEKLKSNRKIK